MSTPIHNPLWASNEKALFLKRRAETFWNEDYLERIVLPFLSLPVGGRVLDVGSGYGALTLTLAKLLSDIQCIGVDLEPRAIQDSTQSALQLKLSNVHFQESNAYHLPFESGLFDAVVCQTLLTHVASPVQAIHEISRVLKQGGVFMAVEYQNTGIPSQLDNVTGDQRDTTWYTEMFRLTQLFIAGKKILGRGDETIGIRLPILLADAGLEVFEVRLNDRVSYAIPPYAKQSERALLVLLNWIYKDEWDHVEKTWETECILAGGGTLNDCEQYFTLLASMNDRLALRQAITAGKYVHIQTMLTYLTFARKSSNNKS